MKWSNLLCCCGLCSCFCHKRSHTGEYSPLIETPKTEQERTAEAEKLDIPREIYALIEQFYIFNKNCYISAALGQDCNMLNGLCNRYYKILTQESFFDATIDAIDPSKAKQSQKYIDAYSKLHKLESPSYIVLLNFNKLFNTHNKQVAENLMIPGRKIYGQKSAGMPAAHKFLLENRQEIENFSSQLPAIEKPMR